MNIVTSQEVIPSIIKECIKLEINPDGLLYDVESFIPSYRVDEEIEEPFVWLFEHPTTLANSKAESLSQTLYLQTPFEFVCGVYDDDDIEESEMLGKNLASRVAASILKNNKKIDKTGSISKIKFDALYPVGEVAIKNKSNNTPATSLRIIVQYYIDWMNCCKKKKNNKRGIK